MESKPLKVGLIGAGRIARAHLAAYLQFPERVQLFAVCDVLPDAAQRFAAQAGVDAVYTDFQKMLDEADIDAVDITTSHDLHAAQTIASAAAGKHVLVEKAMANTLQGCRDMLAATDRARVKLMVAQNLRYIPDSVAAKRLIAEGELGTIRAVRCEATMSIEGINPPGHWMNDGERAGGGVLMTNSIHHIDLLRYYVGEVKRVTGICKAFLPEMVNGAEDMACATLEFENGAIGDVFGNWTTNRRRDAMKYEVFGSSGALYSTPPDREHRGQQFGALMVSSSKREHDAGSRPKFEAVSTDATGMPSDNSFVNEILHFEECCREGAEPVSSGTDNIETFKVIVGIYEASRTGCSVDLVDL